MHINNSWLSKKTAVENVRCQIKNRLL